MGEKVPSIEDQQKSRDDLYRSMAAGLNISDEDIEVVLKESKLIVKANDN